MKHVCNLILSWAGEVFFTVVNGTIKDDDNQLYSFDVYIQNYTDSNFSHVPVLIA